MFSLYYNHPSLPDTILISSGHKTTHTLFVIDGSICPDSIKRINLGGYQLSEYMKNILHIKYPYLKHLLTDHRIHELVTNYTYCSLSYLHDLDMFQYNDIGAQDKTLIFQLPYPSMNNKPLSPDELKQIELKKKKLRHEQGLKLKAIAAERRKKKREGKQQELETLMALWKLNEDHPLIFEEQLSESEYGSIIELEDAINKLNITLHSTPLFVHTDEELYPLIFRDINELTEDEKKLRKKQEFLKRTREGKLKAREKRIQEKKKKEEQERLENERRLKDPVVWANQLRAKRTVFFIS